MKPETLLLLAGVGLIAYHVGKKKTAQTAPAPPNTLPPLPIPTPLGDDLSDPQNMAAETLPALSDDVPFVANPDGIAISDDCETVALGPGFDDRVRSVAAFFIPQGLRVREIYAATTEEMFNKFALPGRESKVLVCMRSGTTAGMLLEDRIMRVIRAQVGGPFLSARLA